jgi:DNA-binding HxlR family transcriptional regulator
VLSQRLGELREAGIVELREKEGYALTAEGRGLGDALAGLDAWAKRWARREDSK